jgi:DNA-binding CsgD family transcriptional regulator
MPTTLARSPTDNNAVIASRLTAVQPDIVTPLHPFASGTRFPLGEGLAEPTPTVATLLALNTALVARISELMTVLEGYDRTARTAARTSCKEGVATALFAPGADLHLSSTASPSTDEARPAISSLHILTVLTPRQIQILDLVLAGQPSKNIAVDLNISRRTVENHRAAIMRRTGATSLPALARMAVGAAISADCKAATDAGHGGSVHCL